jgi:molybdopterin synthase sulfur carrier subunit
MAREEGGRMQVSFYATLRRVVGGKTAEFELGEGATVRELLAAMIARFPALEAELLDADGQLYQHVHIFVNSRDALFLTDGLDATLSAADTVGVFPAVGGG